MTGASSKLCCWGQAAAVGREQAVARCSVNTHAGAHVQHLLSTRGSGEAKTWLLALTLTARCRPESIGCCCVTDHSGT